jgi:tetratricopeptide (TPR) repeat protein
MRYINQKDTKSVQDLIDKSSLLRQQHDLANAIDCLNKAIDIDPNCHAAYFRKALLLITRKDFSNAIQCLNQSISMSPLTVKYHKQKAILLKDLHHYKNALECFNKCVELDKLDFESLNFMGDIKFKQNDLKSADFYYDKALQINPKSYQSYYGKGSVAFENADAENCYANYLSAIELFDKSIRLNPAFTLAHIKKGNSLKEFAGLLRKINGCKDQSAIVCNYKAAIECYERAIGSNSNDAFMALTHKQIVVKELNEFLSFSNKCLIQ